MSSEDTLLLLGLRAVRSAKGLSMGDLARALRVSVVKVSDYERGIDHASLSLATKAASILETTVEALCAVPPQAPGYRFTSADELEEVLGPSVPSEELARRVADAAAFLDEVRRPKAVPTVIGCDLAGGDITIFHRRALGSEAAESFTLEVPLATSIDIAGIDRAALLAALYNATRTGGLGALQDLSRGMTMEEARQWVARCTQPGGAVHFDWVQGRPIKVRFVGDALERPDLYDRDAPSGEGTCARIVASFRSPGA